MSSTSIKTKRKRFLGARFTSTISIALVLFVLGLMALGGMTVARLTSVLREQFTITIVLADNADRQFAPRLMKHLNQCDYVAKVAYVSADSALTILTEELGENPEEFLGYNPLQASIEMQLKSDYAVNDSITPIVAQIQMLGKQNIASIDYNKMLIDAVNDNLQRVGIALSFLALVLLLISVSLIGNTVRLALHAERFIINTMRLVGATAWFIRKPFVCAHMLSGLVAAIIALAGIAALMFYGFSQGVAHVVQDLMLQPLTLACVAGGVVVLGVLISSIAAWCATSRYLRTSVDELYLM